MIMKRRSNSISSRAVATLAVPPVRGAGPRDSELATFAAGCFWGVEASFRELDGVLQTAVGYTAGRVPAASYEQVCSHRTGHAEAVEVWFDPIAVSYDELLDSFWQLHNPTTRNAKGWTSVINTVRRSSSIRPSRISQHVRREIASRANVANGSRPCI